jgi:hypothetical protein
MWRKYHLSRYSCLGVLIGAPFTIFVFGLLYLVNEYDLSIWYWVIPVTLCFGSLFTLGVALLVWLNLRRKQQPGSNQRAGG